MGMFNFYDYYHDYKPTLGYCHRKYEQNIARIRVSQNIRNSQFLVIVLIFDTKHDNIYKKVPEVSADQAQNVVKFENIIKSNKAYKILLN